VAGFGPGNILIRIGAEGTEAIAEMGRVNAGMAETATRSERMGAALKKAAIPAAIALGAIAIGAKHAIDAASELEKQIQKTNKLFGQSADAVVKWSEGLAKSFGLSSDEALTAANRFGQMFENLGYSSKQSAKMSEQMVQLAADLASFNNVPVDQVFTALQAGIGGATRGLKKYGIIIDANALKQKAFAMGLYSGKGALDAHAKSAATMALILQQTSKAQGDFARHSDDAANAQKIQAAETANLSEQLGRGLLPYYESALQLLIKLTNATANHQTALKIAIGTVAAMASAILLANAALKAYEAYQVIATAATWAWNAALDANPIGIVVVAIAALVAALVLAYTKSQTFRNVVDASLGAVATAARGLVAGFKAIEHAAEVAFAWVKSHWIVGALALGPVGAAIVLIATHFHTVEDAARGAVAGIVNAFNAIKNAAAAAASFILEHWRWGAFAFGPLIAGLAMVVNHFDYIKNAARAAFGAIESAINSVVNAVKKLIDWLSKIHVPSIHLPHIPNPFAASTAPFLYFEPVGASAERARAGSSPRATPLAAAGAGVTINFYGPTDPEGAARAIARVMRAHDVRQGRRSV